MDVTSNDGHAGVVGRGRQSTRHWRELESGLLSILIGLPRNKRMSIQLPGAHETNKDLVPTACEGRLSLSEGEGQGEG
jgi:hypothetical protein